MLVKSAGSLPCSERFSLCSPGLPLTKNQQFIIFHLTFVQFVVPPNKWSAQVQLNNSEKSDLIIPIIIVV